MILELDCGNSFIKWRVLDAGTLLIVGEGVVDSDFALLQGLKALKGLSLRFCRLVSVRTAEETGELIASLKGGIQCIGGLCCSCSRDVRRS